VTLARRTREGRSWLVRISLAQTGSWLIERGQVPEAELKDVLKEFTPASLERCSRASGTSAGRLHRPVGCTISDRWCPSPGRHRAWPRPSVPLGSNAPVWPARA
jgi:hypothetical protein